MTTPEIAVTGLGLVTAAGIGVEATWSGVCAGIGTARHLPRLAGLPVDIGCEVPDFDPARSVGRRSSLMHDRFVQLALTAAREAVQDAGLDPSTWDGARVGVVLGTGVGGSATWETQHRNLIERGPGAVSALFVPMLVPNMSAGHVAIDLSATGPNFVTATACASGATAIASAIDLLRRDACDIVVTGGSEAAMTPMLAAGFARMGALSRRLDDPAAASRPFDANRDGFVIGEGAGILVLERTADASARRTRIRAIMAGRGASADAHHMTAPDPAGRGAVAAMRGALADAGVAGTDVDHVNAHGTSTPLNDAAEARAIRAVCPDGPAVTSVKGVTGHPLGSAGAIEAALTVLTLERGLIPPTANLDCPDPELGLDTVAKEPRAAVVQVALSNSFGFGGHNVSLALHRTSLQ